MRRYIVTAFMLIAIATLSLVTARAQDGVYGDYLISSVQKSISLDLEDANLVDVLKLLSQQTTLNFISTEAVKERKLTLYLDKVPLKEALDIMFKANNLTYEFYPEGNIFVVKEMGKPTMELVSKVYRLQYVRVKSGRLDKEIKDVMQDDNLHVTSATWGGGSSSSSSTTSGGGGGGGGGDTGQTESGLKKAVEKVLSEYGKITEDPVTNSLVVIDVPSQIALIDEVVKQLDVPTPKIMIEVEMLDVTKACMQQLGVQWPQTMASLGVTGTRLTSFPFGNLGIGTDHLLQQLVTQAPGGSSTTPAQTWTNTTGGTDPLNFFVEGDKFSPSVLTVLGTKVSLDFLTSQQDTKVLARPKILTLANETAEMKISTNECIGLKQTTSETGGTSVEPERSETGVRLRVTPMVNALTKEITLFVTTFNTDASASNFTISSSIASGQILNPEERSAKAVARLQNGETLLMGGMIKRRSDSTISKVPVLGDIPIIGKAFKHKSAPADKNQERELLVFLTPRLIEDNPVMLASETSVAREQDSYRRDSIGVVLDKFSR